MRNTRFLLALLLLAAPAGARAAGAKPAEKPATSPENFIIDPEKSVGPITPFTSEADLIKAFGADNVRRGQFQMDGTEPSDGSIVFPETSKEMMIKWHGTWESPAVIRIDGDHAPWKTAEGVAVGAPLEDIESYNGRPFYVASYNLNTGARSVSWEDGAVNAAITVEFRPEDTLTLDELRDLSRQLSYRSDDAHIRKLRYRVKSILVTW